MTADPTTIPSTDDAAGDVGSRRRLLRFAGAAAVGLVAGAAVSAEPASADDGLGLVPGTPQTTANPVRNRYTGSAASTSGFVFESDTSGLGSNFSVYPAALAGWAWGTGTPTNGVYGYAERASGAGVVGLADAAGSFGVRAHGPVGVKVTGTSAALSIDPVGTAPGARTDAHAAGELVVDETGAFWVCVTSGSPGTWRKLAAAATAGAFHPIVPRRVYDSRSGARFAPNTSRVVSVATGTDGTANVVPAGATAVTYNLTVSDTAGPNWVAVVPGDQATTTTSTINFPGGDDRANASVSKLDASRQLRVICGDQAGSTHILLDVTGYYL